MKKLIVFFLLLVAACVGLVLLGERGIGPVVVTREDEQKILLLLGQPSDQPTVPGISFRWPIVQEVRTFDRRWLHLDSAPNTVQTRDREGIVVDNYAIWRIEDPLLFYKSFPTGMSEAETQIDREVKAKVREVIGQHTLNEVVTGERVPIMREITDKTSKALAGAGIAIRDVRINRTELPTDTEKNVYARMRAERERLSRKHRAEGEEEARTIRASSDREARVTIAEAQRRAEIERGRGDAEAARIYADAYSADPEFFSFVRSLEAYRDTIGKGTTLVLPPDHPFLKFLQDGK
ncbi:MAG: protease modulator HflC [Myxococcales bacterium]|nr:protease modulator HflC [Myxococcales bacterium]